MNKKKQFIGSLIILGILLTGVVGCSPPSTPAAALPTPTLPAGWETFSASTAQDQCGYAINHPSEMETAAQGEYNWLLRSPSEESSEPIPNFIYISVIPDGFKSDEPGVIYNYDPAETRSLLKAQVGESTSLREDPNLESWFTYTRLADTPLGSHVAQTYENTQPWEFPPGTKEIRYYVQANGCTYLIGGYVSTVGSGQPGAIGEELFDQIITSFRLVP